MRDNTYFYIEEADLFTFYRIPKELIKKYKKMKNDSKILYGLLLDRNSLSIKNQWIDNNRRVYIHYSREEAQEDLGVSNKKMCNLFRELKEYNLIEEVRQGLNKANIIYVKKFIEQPPKQEDTRTCKNYTSGSVKNTCQEVKKLHASNTYINNTDNNNNTLVGRPDETENLNKENVPGISGITGVFWDIKNTSDTTNTSETTSTGNTTGISDDNHTTDKGDLANGGDTADIIDEAISYLNLRANKHFKSTTTKYISLIKALVAQNYTLEDMRKVVDNKVSVWLNDAQYDTFLRPSTLFNAKHFDEYLNEKPQSKLKNTGSNKGKKDNWKDFDQTSYPREFFSKLEKDL